MRSRSVTKDEWKPRFRQVHHQQSGNSQWSWLLLLGLLFCIPIAFGMSSLHAKANNKQFERDRAPISAEISDLRQANVDFLQIPLPIPVPQPVAKTDGGALGGSDAAPPVWRTITVRQGDTLTSIFTKLGLPPQQVQTILANGGPARALDKMQPGKTLQLHIEPEGKLQELVYRLNAKDAVRVRRSGDGFGVSSVHRVPEKRVVHASGTVDTSLFLAARKAGLSHQLTMQLAQLFGWDIDFALDVRRGDKFTVLYEELFLDGEKIDEGGIIAAEFINRGVSFQLVRFTSPTGGISYYTPEGNSMRKTFLRTPVKFSRISSGFDLRRMHPILNTIRAHKGVDYAAPTGTPVMAAGNGKVVFRGSKGGYGKAIILEHGNRFQTLYGHLSRYARNLHSGARVQQGDIIGYVGRSGLATGPHLHYEFLVNGVHRDPLSVALPAAEPIPRQYRETFKDHAEQLLAQLRLVKGTTTVARLD